MKAKIPRIHPLKLLVFNRRGHRVPLVFVMVDLIRDPQERRIALGPYLEALIKFQTSQQKRSDVVAAIVGGLR